MGFGTSMMKKLSCKLPGFEHATQEIKKALKIACEAHGLTDGRHWVAYGPQVIQQGEGEGEDEDEDGSLKKARERLVRKTRETYEPHFCKNINKQECSFLAIMLRNNIDTQDVVDYVLEFLWPRNRDCIILVESLLLTLRRCLHPNFIHGSGAQLGDQELRVLHVDNAAACCRVITSFNVFLGKGGPRSVVEEQDCISSSSSSSSAPNIHNNHINASLSTSKKRKRIILDHEQGSKPVKSKLSDDHLLPKISITYEEDGESTQHESSTSSNNTVKSPNNVDDEMLIVAQLEDNMSLFHIPCTSKFADLKKQINQQFSSLVSSDTDYNLLYHYGSCWCLLELDYDLETCFDHLKLAKHTYIQVRVVPPHIKGMFDESFSGGFGQF